MAAKDEPLYADWGYTEPDYDFIAFEFGDFKFGSKQRYDGETSVTKIEIYRTSKSNRYENKATPLLDLKPNNDVKYGDTLYRIDRKERQFSIDFAFDKLTQKDINQIKRFLSCNKCYWLTLVGEVRHSYYDRDDNAKKRIDREYSLGDIEIKTDENSEAPAPLKEAKYFAKITGTPKLSYLCFDESEKKDEDWFTDQESESFEKMRVYKGTGSVQFTCYDWIKEETVNG